ncbi:MAG: large conductance mechanosensitive channel protein MscL [Planctomycetaceae bacterium]
MGLLKEFKDFAMKGNVVDMAVGIIIGGAFGTIVKSMVDDVMMPVLGAVAKTGSVGNQFLWLSIDKDKPASLTDAVKSGEPYIAWGPFLQNCISFVIVAFSVFMLIKVMNKAQSFWEKEEVAAPAAPPEPPEEVKLLREIRDALAQR